MPDRDPVNRQLEETPGPSGEPSAEGSVWLVPLGPDSNNLGLCSNRGATAQTLPAVHLFLHSRPLHAPTYQLMTGADKHHAYLGDRRRHRRGFLAGCGASATFLRGKGSETLELFWNPALRSRTLQVHPCGSARPNFQGKKFRPVSGCQPTTPTLGRPEMRPSPRQVTALLRAARPAARRRGASQPAQLLLPRRLSTTTSPQSTSPGPSSSSVNATEISHFSALASSWWDPHGPSRPLHLMNPLRHDFIRACISSPSSPSSPSASSATHPHPHPDQLHYLDIGCGGGIFAESAARLPTTASVTAIDPSPEILAVARAHAKRDPSLRQKLRYLGETVESLPGPGPAGGGGYDVVSVFEVVEHVDHPARFLDRVGQFVRPGGWLVMSTIARTWTSWVVTNLVAEDLLGVVPKGTHDWAKYVNVEELEAYFRGQGGLWGDIRVMGVVYVPGLGWREVKGSEKVGNYFLGVQRVG